MELEEYQICKDTVMDTIADPDIVFNEKGISNYVNEHKVNFNRRVPGQDIVSKKLSSTIHKIKKTGKRKKYDCVIGVSGGVDSTFLAYRVKEMGLRPLAVHVDNGWNSDLAVSNIEKTLKKLDIDLYTEVLDWEEFKNIQLSFLKASVPDGEIPTDHAIYASLYKTAAKFNIKNIVIGTTMKTESIMPNTWASGHADFKYIKNILRIFGKRKIKSYPHLSLFKLFYYIVVLRIKKVSILDYMDYNKNDAVKLLEEKLDWKDYGGKHYESVYTRFFQGHILFKKFHIDKRKAHLSVLILNDIISRNEAIEELEKPPYPSLEMENEDREFVMKKFELTEDEFQKIMKLPIKSINDYPNNNWLVNKLLSFYAYIKYPFQRLE